MQRYSLAAMRDGLDLPTIQTLASLANWGRHESNCERDFHRAIPFLYDTRFPSYEIAVEIFDPDEGVTKEIEVPMLLPSVVLHALHKKDDAALWASCIGATSTKTQTFWNAFRNDRASRWDHPVLQPAGANQ